MYAILGKLFQKYVVRSGNGRNKYKLGLSFCKRIWYNPRMSSHGLWFAAEEDPFLERIAVVGLLWKTRKTIGVGLVEL